MGCELVWVDPAVLIAIQVDKLLTAGMIDILKHELTAPTIRRKEIANRSRVRSPAHLNQVCYLHYSRQIQMIRMLLFLAMSPEHESILAGWISYERHAVNMIRATSVIVMVVMMGSLKCHNVAAAMYNYKYKFARAPTNVSLEDYSSGHQFCVHEFHIIAFEWD